MEPCSRCALARLMGAANVNIRHLNHSAEYDDLIEPNKQDRSQHELEQLARRDSDANPYNPCGFFLALAGSTVSVSCTGP